MATARERITVVSIAIFARKAGMTTWVAIQRAAAMLGILFATALAVPVHAGEAVPIPDAAKPYKGVGDLSGTLTIAASDALSKLAALWTEEFRRHYPAVTIRVENKDSKVAAQALIDGTAHVAPMSRLMYNSEVKKFEEKFGYRPTSFAVAVDALVVYVHKDNPIEGLTMEQVDAVFSKLPANGQKPFTQWGDLDLGGEWAEAPINVYGLPPSSGTYAFFKDHALNRASIETSVLRGEFRAGIKEQPDIGAVIQRIAEDRFGIGYGGSAYATPNVRMLPLADNEFSPFVEPTVKNVTARLYPLRRYLYIYVNQPQRKILKSSKPLPPAVREFLRYVFSRQGQAAVLKENYAPVENWIVERAQAAIK
jgi:phosphate transport system substrate-binding protein